MQKVILTFKTVNVEETAKQKKAVFDTATKTHIVASTKSFNNLTEEYASNGMPVSSSAKSDLWLEREKTEKAIAEMVTAQIADKDTAALVTEYLKKVLDGACVYYKPITRKK